MRLPTKALDASINDFNEDTRSNKIIEMLSPLPLAATYTLFFQSHVR